MLQVTFSIRGITDFHATHHVTSVPHLLSPLSSFLSSHPTSHPPFFPLTESVLVSSWCPFPVSSPDFPNIRLCYFNMSSPSTHSLSFAPSCCILDHTFSFLFLSLFCMKSGCRLPHSFSSGSFTHTLSRRHRLGYPQHNPAVASSSAPAAAAATAAASSATTASDHRVHLDPNYHQHRHQHQHRSSSFRKDKLDLPASATSSGSAGGSLWVPPIIITLFYSHPHSCLTFHVITSLTSS